MAACILQSNDCSGFFMVSCLLYFERNPFPSPQSDPKAKKKLLEDGDWKRVATSRWCRADLPLTAPRPQGPRGRRVSAGRPPPRSAAPSPHLPIPPDPIPRAAGPGAHPGTGAGATWTLRPRRNLDGTPCPRREGIGLRQASSHTPLSPVMPNDASGANLERSPGTP